MSEYVFSMGEGMPTAGENESDDTESTDERIIIIIWRSVEYRSI